MTVVVQTPFNSHVGNGVTTVFGFTFQLLDADDLVVSIDGVVQVSSLYSISGLGIQAGGSITFLSAPANGAEVLLAREIALQRETDYQNNGDLRADTVDLDFNRIWQALQGIFSRLTGTLRAPYPEQLDELPSSVDRAGRMLAFDETTGQPEPTTFTSDEVANAVAAAYGTGSTADAVTFLPAGSSAVATTVQAKLRKFVTLSDKGITPASLAAANTVAMQALIDEISAAGGGDIAADAAGTYNFLQLKPKNGVRLLGFIGQTIFKLDNAAGSGDDLFEHNESGLDGSLDDFALDGLILDGNGKDAAFVLYGCQRLRFTDVVFQNAGTYGCALQARPGFAIALPQDDVVMLRCQFNNNGSDAPGWDGLDIKWCTNTKLIACTATGNSDVGLNVRGRGVDLIGCDAVNNGTNGVLIQSNDATEDSYVRIVGGSASGTTAGNGLELQSLVGNELHVSVAGFQSFGNAGSGVQFSGDGLTYGAISGIETRANTQQGVNITTDCIGHMVMDGGLVLANLGNGVNNSGKNCVFAGIKIVGNGQFGYRENAGADNNYLMPSCVVSGNTGGQIATRVGLESDDGFLSVRANNSLRIFPGQTTGLELQADSGGTFVSLVSVGDAASIDARVTTKGNGQFGIFKDNGARQIGLFRQGGTATVNYPDMVASLTGAAVQYRAAGADANIDVALLPKGTGLPQFGSFAANADAPVVGYISIKDAGGTVRKLAVIA